MLSDRDFQRIVREIDSVKSLDVVRFVEESSPWFRLLDRSIQRVSQVLEEIGVFYVFYGLRPLPLYGVPYIARDRIFAVKVGESLDGVVEAFRGRGFEKVIGPRGRISFLDLQNNNVVMLLDSPRPLKWSDELAGRCLQRMGLRILSPEDYALSLIVGETGTMRMELAAKVIYANMDRLDKAYLEKRASELSAGKFLKAILEGVEAASRR
ncbi:MAG: hypothetical protein L2C94_006800 [Aigarchaeota archaeon]|nr:hypothetical protein [Candidatus Wolframiiraptor gerlachensis]